MTDTDWGDESGEEGEEPRERRKRRVPKWVWWGCGGGCLLMTLVLGALAVFATHLYREGTDPEKQWPRLHEVLYFEERPAGLEFEFGTNIGADQFRLRDTAHGLRATLIEFPSSATNDYRRMLEPDPGLLFGLGQALEPERGTVVVQGREVPCLRFARIKQEPEGSGFGPGIRLDLTGTRARPRTLELRHVASGRISDAEVEAFLAPFDVWREP